MKKRFTEFFLYLAFLTLIVIVVWIFLDIKKTARKKENLSVSPQELRELNPKLDESVFEELKRRTTK